MKALAFLLVGAATSAMAQGAPPAGSSTPFVVEYYYTARWGFADASHLSRSFKCAFGMSPRDYRAARTVPEQPGPTRRQ